MLEKQDRGAGDSRKQIPEPLALQISGYWGDRYQLTHSIVFLQIVGGILDYIINHRLEDLRDRQWVLTEVRKAAGEWFNGIVSVINGSNLENAIAHPDLLHDLDRQIVSQVESARRILQLIGDNLCGNAEGPDCLDGEGAIATHEDRATAGTIQAAVERYEGWLCGLQALTRPPQLYRDLRVLLRELLVPFGLFGVRVSDSDFDLAPQYPDLLRELVYGSVIELLHLQRYLGTSYGEKLTKFCGVDTFPGWTVLDSPVEISVGGEGRRGFTVEISLEVPGGADCLTPEIADYLRYKVDELNSAAMVLGAGYCIRHSLDRDGPDLAARIELLGFSIRNGGDSTGDRGSFSAEEYESDLFDRYISIQRSRVSRRQGQKAGDYLLYVPLKALPCREQGRTWQRLLNDLDHLLSLIPEAACAVIEISPGSRNSNNCLNSGLFNVIVFSEIVELDRHDTQILQAVPNVRSSRYLHGTLPAWPLASDGEVLARIPGTCFRSDEFSRALEAVPRGCTFTYLDLPRVAEGVFDRNDKVFAAFVEELTLLSADVHGPISCTLEKDTRVDPHDPTSPFSFVTTVASDERLVMEGSSCPQRDDPSEVHWKVQYFLPQAYARLEKQIDRSIRSLVRDGSIDVDGLKSKLDERLRILGVVIVDEPLNSLCADVAENFRPGSPTPNPTFVWELLVDWVRSGKVEVRNKEGGKFLICEKRGEG